MVRLFTVGFTVVSLCLKESLAMPTRGRFVCHVHCLVHDGAVRSSPCRPHHEKTSDEISVICLLWLILRANPLFLFLSCGIRVASMSSVDSIPSPNGVLILRCGYQSFLIIKIVLSILFTSVFLFKWIRSLQHSQDQLSVLLNGVCFIRSKLPLFSHTPTLVSSRTQIS